jgi:EAL domain-containing protein (putative c-di-GMP-specific phosphodiesterase class I)
MNLLVVAEGVETCEQFDCLLKLGCLRFQGYYFGRPVPCDEFEAIILSQESAQ